LTLQQLVYFRTAAALGSFNAAARALHCTQPAVSEQVRQLERELGVALFARGGRGLTLTSAGRAFLGHAERVAEAADDALASVGRRTAARQRVVTIGTFRNAPYYDIAGLGARFCAVHPERRLQLPGQNSADVATAVRGGDIEAGIVVLPVDDRVLDVKPLFRDEVLVLSADPERTRVPMSIERLGEAPLILYDASHGFDDPTRRQLAARAQEAGVVLAPRIEVEHVETAFQLVALGLGDTIAARAVTRRAGLPAGVSAVSLAEPIHDSFALVTRRGAQLSPGTVALVDLVAEWADSVAAQLV
jgi:DNA-binding transcriptional LysR family regulator